MEEKTIGIKTYIADIKTAINRSIKESGLSRHQVADQINDMIGLEDFCITKEVIDSWTKGDVDRAIPSKYIYYFCVATSSNLLVQAIIAPLGLKTISGKAINLLDLGESEFKKINAERQRKTALLRLGLDEEKNNG
jgi:hypothetical protein